MRRLLASVVLLWGCVPAKSETCSVGPCTETQENTGITPPASPVVVDAGNLPSSFCGDGVWDPAHEECDNGASCSDGRNCTNDRLRCQASSAAACQARAGDGCSERCTRELGYVCLAGTDCRRLECSSPADPGCGSGEESPDATQLAAPPDMPVAPVPDAGQPSGETPLDGTPATGTPLDPPQREQRCRRWSFEEPQLLSGLDTTLDYWAPAIASDNRTLFFAASQPGGVEQIYFATRVGRSNTFFSRPTRLANVHSQSGDGTPLLSFDGLTLYFYSRRPGGAGDRDLWFATRPDRAAPFAAPSLLAGLGSAGVDHLPALTANELTLLFVSTRAGGLGASDVWFTQRASRNLNFGSPQPFAAVSGAGDEGRAAINGDGSSLFFASDRAGGQGGQDLWFTTLSNDGLAFETPTDLSSLNSSAQDLDPILSFDERELFFASNRNGHSELFRALTECDE